MTVFVVPTRDPSAATDGSLLYPVTALEAAAGSPSFLRMLRSLVPEVFAGADFPLLSVALTLGVFAVVPRVVPWVLAGVSGFRIARGPPDVDVLPTASRPPRASSSRRDC